MPKPFDYVTIVTNRVCIQPAFTGDFISWQAKFNETISEFPGFVSLEIQSSEKDKKTIWTIVQRFYHSEHALAWRNSQMRQELIGQLNAFTGANPIEELETEASTLTSGVTEVFVTHVNPDDEKAYHAWVAKIHQAEAKFPGFRSLYIQSPIQGKSQTWLTLLQFDSSEHLDQWLSSPERQKILNESQSLIQSCESHRVISPYAGWFASIDKSAGVVPAWKQSMIVLLVLFPIVMLELKFLPLLIGLLNPSLSTFIGNAISVSLLAWPFMPIAIKLLRWWLVPKENSRSLTMLGTLVVIGFYLLEIILFWN